MKKILICVAIVIAVVLLVYFGISQFGGETNTHPYSVMVEGRLYTRGSVAQVQPEPDQYSGTITECVENSRLPEKDNQTNNPDCLNQPYAVVDGVLLVRWKDGKWYQYSPSES